MVAVSHSESGRISPLMKTEETPERAREGETSCVCSSRLVVESISDDIEDRGRQSDMSHDTKSSQRIDQPLHRGEAVSGGWEAHRGREDQLWEELHEQSGASFPSAKGCGRYGGSWAHWCVLDSLSLLS
jgi:hypothetical protein